MECSRQHRSPSRSTSSTNIAATITSFPAGGCSDKLGLRGPLLVTAAGVPAFLLAYSLFAVSGPMIVMLGAAFALAGVGIGCAETAEHAAVAAFAPNEPRGSAFGLLATVQPIGNLAASAVAGLLYTVACPAVAFTYLAVWMLIALATLGWATTLDRDGHNHQHPGRARPITRKPE